MNYRPDGCNANQSHSLCSTDNKLSNWKKTVYVKSEVKNCMILFFFCKQTKKKAPAEL